MTPNPLMLADGHFHEWTEVEPLDDPTLTYAEAIELGRVVDSETP